MPQSILPLIPHGATQITGIVSVYRSDTSWTYFYQLDPLYSHASEDELQFKIIIAMLIDAGSVRSIDVQKTFGVTKSKVDRAVRKYRKEGIEGFFRKPNKKRKATQLTPEKLIKAQELLNEGHSRVEVAKAVDVQKETLRKAINGGRLQEPKPATGSTDKSTRTVEDLEVSTIFGVGCTDVTGRTLASLGKLNGIPMRFEASRDVPKGGVLCAVPALIANGLFEKSQEMLGKIKGYYNVIHILLFLAYMGLCRIKNPEKIRTHAPGELGNLIGLDRTPEAKCLRKKMDELSKDDSAKKWALHLSRYWMTQDPKAAGVIYIDGHVRVYHGRKNKLPRKYVSREKLCLRGVTDYWVNDALGRPFFYITKTVDPGLIQVLEEEIIPQLLKDIPNQPTEEEMAKNPYKNRFVMVFDREGYSPDLFKKLWTKHRIGCITYHKYPKEDWANELFEDKKVSFPKGEVVEMKLAEMGSALGKKESPFWVREVRRLTKSGHQTSIISTAYDLSSTQLSAQLFSRWCQENFFQYAMQHFEIDLLMDFGTLEVSDTQTVVNPVHRALVKQRNSMQGQLNYRTSMFGALTLHPEDESDIKKYEKWQTRKSELCEEIQHIENQLENIKSEIKQTPKHLEFHELPERERFKHLVPGRKRLMDTIRMICYRSETAMTNLIRSENVTLTDARRILQDLFVNDADLIPCESDKTLTIKVHSASTPATNRSLIQLFDELNNTETIYPGTDLRLLFELVGSKKEF